MELDPRARELHEGRRFPLCRHGALEALFRDAGLDDVRCEAIDIPTELADFDDYCRPYLGDTGPAPAYVASLDDAGRAALAGELGRRLPRGTDGGITLTARAWAVRATSR